MSKLFEITYSWKPRTPAQPFDEEDYQDASRLFLALRRFLARMEGQFLMRLGATALVFDLDPDLSTVFEELPGVLEALAGEAGVAVELSFFEQGTDLTLVLQRRGGDIEIRFQSGPSTGRRYADAPADPVLVSAPRFLEAWRALLGDVLGALRAVDPGLRNDQGYQDYVAKLAAIGPAGSYVAARREQLDAPRLPPLKRRPALGPAMAA